MQLGFDYCYDKRLYDRLEQGDVGAIRGHLDADLDYQQRLLRFLENHDEPRAASHVPAPGARDRPAPSLAATLPGLTLWHDGQAEGRDDLHPGLPRPPGRRAAGRRSRRLAPRVCGPRPPPSGRARGRRRDVTGWPDDTSADRLARVDLDRGRGAAPRRGQPRRRRARRHGARRSRRRPPDGGGCSTDLHRRHDVRPGRATTWPTPASTSPDRAGVCTSSSVAGTRRTRSDSAVTRRRPR